MYLFIYLSIMFEVETNQIFQSISISFIFGFLFPVSLFFYLRHSKKISNNDATKKEERQLPYLFSTLFAFLTVIILALLHSNLIIIIAWATYAINTVLLIIINKYWKISAHAIGVASPWAIILFNNFSLFPIFILILAVVGWSRIKLNVHTLLQVIAGSIFGFTFTLIELILGLKILG